MGRLKLRTWYQQYITPKDEKNHKATIYKRYVKPVEPTEEENPDPDPVDEEIINEESRP